MSMKRFEITACRTTIETYFIEAESETEAQEEFARIQSQLMPDDIYTAGLDVTDVQEKTAIEPTNAEEGE